jgi:peptidyl-prolyl cis-trans isomerase C
MRLLSIAILLPLFGSACAATPQATPGADGVILSSTRATISKADFDAELSRIPEADRAEFLLSRSRVAGLVENIMINRVLAQEARDLKIDKEPAVQEEIKNQIEKVLAKHRASQFARQLETKDFTSAARELYLTEPARSTRPAQYRAWHTLILTATRDKAIARARAEEVRAKVLAGDDLELIAKEYSEDPSAPQKGGELEMTNADKFDPAFAAALKRMQPGDVSEIVETRYGFHVIYLVELLPEKRFTFEESKQALILESRDAHVKATWESYLRKIREDPSIKLNADALEALRPKIPDNVKPIYDKPETIKAPPRKKSTNQKK